MKGNKVEKEFGREQQLKVLVGRDGGNLAMRGTMIQSRCRDVFKVLCYRKQR